MGRGHDSVKGLLIPSRPFSREICVGGGGLGGGLFFKQGAGVI